MEKKLNVENCIAFNQCIMLDPVLFKSFINDFITLSNNNFGYKEVSTAPFSSFYGLYVGTILTEPNRENWRELRNKHDYLSNIDNIARVNDLKITLAQENGHFEMHAIDFIFKYDAFLYIMLWSKKHYGDVLIDFLKTKFDDETLKLVNKYIDFVVEHMDKIDKINEQLLSMKIKEKREFEIEKDINLSLKPEE